MLLSALTVCTRMTLLRRSTSATLTISSVCIKSMSSIEMNGINAPTAPEIVVYTSTSRPPSARGTFVILQSDHNTPVNEGWWSLTT